MTDMNVVVLILLYVADYSAPERGAEYCNEYVCPRSYLQKYTSDLQIFVHITYGRSSSGGVVVRYVLPVLWMTSYLLISQGFSTSPPS